MVNTSPRSHNKINRICLNHRLSLLIQMASQQQLTTFSVVAIKHLVDLREYYLATSSVLRSQLYLMPPSHSFDHELFYVEREGNAKAFNQTIEYEQAVLFRHKTSNKYLAFRDSSSDEHDLKYKLGLSEQKFFFKIYPCYQYQTKISIKVKFNEEFFLGTEIAPTRNGFLSTTPEQPPASVLQVSIGLNLRSKFIFHSYMQLKKEEASYNLGSVVWLSHIESSRYLSVVTKGDKEEIVFESLKAGTELQGIAGLWSIEGEDSIRSSGIQYDMKFRLRNLMTGQYMVFSKNYRLVDNERIYQIYLEELPSDQGKFAFRPIKDEDVKQFAKEAYLSLMHCDSRLYIGCRREQVYSETKKVSTFSYFDDEDLFQLTELTETQEETVRFIFALRREFQLIDSYVKAKQQHTLAELHEIEQIYQNVKRQMIKLKSEEKLLKIVQNQMPDSIRRVCEHLNFYRAPPNSDSSFQHRKILMLCYDILIFWCEGHSSNQVVAAQYTSRFVQDICQDLGAEEFLSTVFHNNKTLICKPPDALGELQGAKIVRGLFGQLIKRNKLKDTQYWGHIKKLLNVLRRLLFYDHRPIDINQRLISEELFRESVFEKIFFPIRLSLDRIQVFNSIENKYQDIEAINDAAFENIVEEVFYLLSNLCAERSLIAKKTIHGYFSANSPSAIKTLISFLSRPLRQPLYNCLLCLMNNLYVDSCPRIERHRPLSVVFFIFGGEKSQAEVQEGHYSSRLREMLQLKAEESRVCRPLHVSTLIKENQTEPSLNEEELVKLRLTITEELLGRRWSVRLLESILLMFRLECYTINETMQIFHALSEHLLLDAHPLDIITKLLEVLEQMFVLLQELELKKLTTFLKHKFISANRQISDAEVCYVLPHSTRIPFTMRAAGQSGETQHSKDYNELRDTLSELCLREELKVRIIEMFCRNDAETNSMAYLSSMFGLILKFNEPKKLFLRLLMRSIIMTHEEGAVFDVLFGLCKRLKYLTSVSECWIGDNDSDSMRGFLRSLKEVTSYMFDGYILNSEEPPARKAKIGINRQLLIGNMGVHSTVLQFLEKNSYVLLNVRSKKEIKRKQVQVFEQAFQFLLDFIKGSRENKQLVYAFLPIVAQFLSHPEMGQAKVLCEFFDGERDFLRQITPAMVEAYFYRIVQSDAQKSHEAAEFNPELVSILLVLVKNAKKGNKHLIDQIYTAISREGVLKRFLYLEPVEKTYNFCLKMQKLRLQPLQVPIAYHIKALRFVNRLANSNDSIRTSFRFKLMQLIKVDHLLQILALPDIFAHQGIEAQLNFLLKEEVLSLLHYYLDKTELHAQLYESQRLWELLLFYEQAFLKGVPKKLELAPQSNENMFIVYLEEYLRVIEHYELNPLLYYAEKVAPFLTRLSGIFAKVGSQERSKIAVLLKSIQERMSAATDLKDLTPAEREETLEDVQIKWRNFVDQDQDNSPEEKYAKKIILEILKRKETARLLALEQKQFYKLIASRQKSFFVSLLRLVRLLFEEKDIDNGRKESTKLSEGTLALLTGYLKELSPEQIPGVKALLESEQFIEVALKLFTRPEFDLSKIHMRHIFLSVVSVFNFFLRGDQDYRVARSFYRIFQDNQSSYKYLQLLNEAALSIVQRVDSTHHLQQINSALQDMYLCVEPHEIHIDEEAFTFLTLIASYPPFTSFLRIQYSYFSVDFLEKIYSLLPFLFYKETQTYDTQRVTMNVSVVRAAEYILAFMVAMMTNANTVNQNFIVDNKFPEFVSKVLKIQVCERAKGSERRERLLDKIAKFYESNGIDIGELLDQKVQLIDFDHPYLLNRLKYVLLHTLVQCTVANAPCVSRIRMKIPLELLKVNLIWLYEQYLSQGAPYRQDVILRQRQSWDELVQHGDLDSLFLRIGFHYFELIEVFESFEQERAQGGEEVSEQFAVDEQKEKERVVRKFFQTLTSDKQSRRNESKLQSQTLSAEMTEYYKRYYEAMAFFRKNSGTIEVSIDGRITRAYFPRLPITSKLEDDFEEDFRMGVNRISRDEKLKSLLELSQKFYGNVQGEVDFVRQVSTRFAKFGVVLRALQKEKDLFMAAWICSVLVTTLYLLCDYLDPSYSFLGRFFYYLIVSTPISIALLLSTLSSFGLGLLNGVYLFAKKMPLLHRMLTKEYKESKEQIKDNWHHKEWAYVWWHMASESLYNLYIITFLLLTLLHPFFAGFILVEIFTRIELGEFVIRSIKETGPQLLVTTGFLLVFNFIYSQYNYAYLTSDVGYGQICMNMYTCMLFLSDQNIKSGSGFYGSVSANYIFLSFDIKFFVELFYMVVCQKVVFEIFSGLIIDKFSELREKEEAIVEDEESECLICGQQRFNLDLQLQGFEAHTEQTHRAFNYISYIFYVRRLAVSEFGVVETLVNYCLSESSYRWVPEGISLQKIKKESEEKEDEEEDEAWKKDTYCKEKSNDFRRIKGRLESVYSDLKFLENQDSLQ